ncbi:hypothetical protein SAMN06265379_10681 [Saccharicrinis carchari]|uniref:Uncharacterized protein n=1 Tax=Saccharicrinis carchari TaxID=1168039 RepID=A0A521DP82_SACCC|nr:hypothetical protein [Saccharicrinis carchari]SMO73412.1 hypothetical protein SAMN06265379_10681 [Saccharicrinis carchari]
MKRASLYPARERAINVGIIKGLMYADSQASYDMALNNFIENIHPSLFAEMDWMEISVPPERKENARVMNDALFLNNLEHVLKLRGLEFEMNDDELFDEIRENKDFYRYILEVEPRISKAFNEHTYQAIVNSYNQSNKKKGFITYPPKTNIPNRRPKICMVR